MYKLSKYHRIKKAHPRFRSTDSFSSHRCQCPVLSVNTPASATFNTFYPFCIIYNCVFLDFYFLKKCFQNTSVQQQKSFDTKLSGALASDAAHHRSNKLGHCLNFYGGVCELMRKKCHQCHVGRLIWVVAAVTLKDANLKLYYRFILWSLLITLEKQVKSCLQFCSSYHATQSHYHRGH